MPWVRFTAGFDFKPRRAGTVAYQAGQVKPMRPRRNRGREGRTSHKA